MPSGFGGRLAIALAGSLAAWFLFACFFFRLGQVPSLGGAGFLLAASAAAWGWARKRAPSAAPLLACFWALSAGVAAWVAFNLRPYGFLTAPHWPYGRHYTDLTAYLTAFGDHLLLGAVMLGPLWLASRAGSPDAPRLRGGDWGRPILSDRASGPTWAGSFWGFAFLIVLLDLAAQTCVHCHRDARWLAWTPLIGAKCLLNAVIEEILYRGVLLSAWRRILPERWANLAQALQYGSFHTFFHVFGGPVPFGTITAAVGYLFGWASLRTGSLSWAIGIHALLDLFPEHESFL